MTKAYQYTADGYYAGEAEDYGLLPNNASYTAPPAQPWNHVWPRWAGDAWELVEDHRERAEPYFPAEFAQEATPYWLADEGDDWQSPPRTMKDPGPLPVGHSLTRPEKPVSAARNEKLREIDAGYESALVAALTMPDANPTPMTISVETSALLAVDPDAVDSIRVVLDSRRDKLRVAVEAADTVDEVESVVVDYPV